MRMIALALTVAGFWALTACTAPVEKYRHEGVRLYQQQQYDAALEAFTKSLADDASDPVSNAYAGLIHYRAGHLTQAAYHAKIALDMDPSNPEAREVLLASLIKQDKSDEAINNLERLSALADKTRDPRWLKGDAKRRYQMETEERLFLGRAHSRYQVASTYERLGDLDNARLWYERALQQAPNNTRVLMALARLYDRAGNKERLVEYVRRVYALDPAAPGLVDLMTRNNIALSSITSVPPTVPPMVPAPQ